MYPYLFCLGLDCKNISEYAFNFQKEYVMSICVHCKPEHKNISSKEEQFMQFTPFFSTETTLLRIYTSCDT